MVLISMNPATGDETERFEEHSKLEIDGRLHRSTKAFASWQTTSLEDRSELLHRVAKALLKSSAKCAQVMAREMGKPVKQGIAEVKKCAAVCDFYAENGQAFMADEPVRTEANQSFIRYDPLGPVLAVMPWNFPFWQVFRFAAPAIMAGNVGLLKHASNVPRCGLTIEALFLEAGFPEGVFQTLLIGSARVEELVGDERVKAVTLTGSEKAGVALGSAAGRAIKKVVLELGGSDPFIVLDDADVEVAARVAAEARCLNSGQSCIAAKRFIVQASVHDDFVDRFVHNMQSLKIGDPMDEATDVGPQARADLRVDLHAQVTRSQKLGAEILTGGEPLDRAGFYYPPTVLSNATREMPVAAEEVFGPVAPVFKVDDDQGALRIANDSRYGLGASVWTADASRAAGFVRGLEVGCVFVNAMVKSDQRLPFGGVKRSGLGRELGRQGIHEFVNVKSVWIEGV